ncbi:hypothetical protein ACHAXR_003034 [Thalassiosira sp. AJA248-18]
MNNNQRNTTPQFDTQIENNNPLMVPLSTVQPSGLSRSMVCSLPSRVSLIDSTLAQACSMKRARGLSQKLLTKSKSDSGLAVHRGNNVSAKFTYKNRSSGSTVKIVSSNSATTVSSNPAVVSSSASSQANSSWGSAKTMNVDDMCPYTFIRSVLIGDDQPDEVDGGDQQHPVRQMQPLHETEFLTPTEEQIAAYSNDAITAVRTSDVEALRKIYSDGRTLRCCNRFGESLLHVACRRSNAAVVSFLLNEANVSPRIKDDYGRTPMHDACWRGNPEYDIVELLLRVEPRLAFVPDANVSPRIKDDYGRTPMHDACWRGNPEYDIVELLLRVEPRLAFVPDVRGHKPFQYARREHWGAWKGFLDQKRDLILL